eukprot:TRINITY_DN126_c0_g1_i2.p1 TRINITY_DN126_c0_g1~~TRINITY_DN126_c0_g1_i2.p1  ORF type:complete len:208 (-),score=35.08 TRINITY_DN126_c0_g1_i2:73-696(-)
MRTNCVAWNPMEAFNIALANEDHNVYTFDMRNMEVAKFVHTDHVSAVLAIDFSPTGQEFVTGSYDRTIRIFGSTMPRSRDVYHTKRMQRIFSVQYSGDAQFIFAGSDDTNIRVWKSQASKELGVVTRRQQSKQSYNDALVQRYKHLPEIRRIHRHRHVPKEIKKTQEVKGIMKRSKQRKLENVRRHSTPGSVKKVSDKKKPVVKTQE